MSIKTIKRSISQVITLTVLMLAIFAGQANAAQQFQGLCSYVKIEILQELALERVGFLATLEVTNNEGDASITDFSALLTFETELADGTKVDASDLFFVQPPVLTGITAIDGTGIISPGQTAHVEWFIIPKLTAGGTTPDGLEHRCAGNETAGTAAASSISWRAGAAAATAATTTAAATAGAVRSK